MRPYRLLRLPPLLTLSAAALAGTLWLSACASHAPPDAASAKTALPDTPLSATQRQQWLDRVSWGASDSADQQLQRLGLQRWLDQQLAPQQPPRLPEQAQQQIAALEISQRSMLELQRDIAAQRQAARTATEQGQGQGEGARLRQEVQRHLNQLAAQAQQRQVLRALYSPAQLQEQMTWFWMNHFNVSTRKAETRLWIGDYEERAIRPNALGNFRSLLEASMRHPAMLLYLDNASNAQGHINENYARELLELHTMGVGSGYTQADVQAMAHVLTGVGFSTRDADAPPPRMAPALQADYRRDGFFEFNPKRHDCAPQVLLGQPLRAKGMAAVDEALDRIVASPATAQFIARKLAVFFISDNPPPALVQRTAAAFSRSHGDIAATLRSLLTAPEALAQQGQRFKDPMHYVLGAVRLGYDERVASDVRPVIGWINRLGQPIYGHETPDGYPASQSDWASSGQMAARFDVARQIATRSAVLFRAEPQAALEQPPYPDLAQRATAQARVAQWSAASREALAKARNVPDWNTYFLSAPEMMVR
ncbi:DUF1800 domain-containing protein [Comamonas sp. JUb58]|uniref:DUF1800 domain-containing protein n=1 Tax=Comamonas sp. JUb58 TaxID=2485114 RepID=UPI0010623AB1|nr:DUF1800 domain-containing protein [Comamonas sp. JUb58]TDS73588.1 uncharacterized protein (DUF1800 family) [Comamonas sp. JUb58]